MTHHRLEVIDWLACFADVAIVEATTHWAVPFRISEKRQLASGSVCNSVACIVSLPIYNQLGYICLNFIIGIKAEGSEVVACTCCATSEVAEVSAVVTVHIKRDTCTCVGITCTEDTAPAIR